MIWHISERGRLTAGGCPAHLWLISVLTVTWTGYAAAFGSVASALPIALSVAAFGIVVGGATDAMSAGTSIGSDVVRRVQQDLVTPVRRLALGTGLAAEGLAVAGLVLRHHHAHAPYRDLIAGAGLPALIVSALTGAVTLGLVMRRRFEPARYSAALAVGATIAAAAQQPRFLPGLSIEQAATTHDTLVAVVVAVVGGAIIVFPSRTLLLRLTLGGQLAAGDDDDRDERGRTAEHGSSAHPVPRALPPVGPARARRIAGVCLVGGLGLLIAAESGWAHAIGVVLLLIGTAVSNAAVRSELVASRVRIVEAADEQRRQVVRDLHDGAQQRLVHAVFVLQRAHDRDGLPPDVRALVEEGLMHTRSAIGELRELAQGIHPGVLTHDGLAAAVQALADRAPLPVEIEIPHERYPTPVESAAYFVAAEALTNVAKYARASTARITATRTPAGLRLVVEDDGVGRASAAPGRGLSGLRDRLAALGGRLAIDSPPGLGTRISAEIPLPHRRRPVAVPPRRER